MTEICWGQDDRQASDAKPREPPWPPWSCKSIHLISRVRMLEFMAPLTLFDVDIGRNVAFRPAKATRFSALDKRLAAEAVLFVSIVTKTGFMWGETGSLWYWIWILDQHNHVEIPKIRVHVGTSGENSLPSLAPWFFGRKIVDSINSFESSLTEPLEPLLV